MTRVLRVLDEADCLFEAAPSIGPLDSGQSMPVMDRVVSTTFGILLCSWAFEMLNQAVIQPVNMPSTLHL